MKPETIVNLITVVSSIPGHRERISTRVEPSASTPLQASDDSPGPHSTSTTQEISVFDEAGIAITPIP